MLRAALLSVVLAAPVAVATDADAVAATYSGRYEYTLEHAIFAPNGGTECWELLGNLGGAIGRGKRGSMGWGSVDLVVRGILSAPGRYGNFGDCTHQLRVIKVLSITNRKSG